MNINSFPFESGFDRELTAEIKNFSNNPLISELLYSIKGFLVVLDAQRHVITINDSFAHILGIKDISEILGLRIGEAMSCIHAFEKTSGCGTTEYCPTCGISFALQNSIEKNEPTENICALTTLQNNEQKELALSAKCSPIIIENKKFFLLFLQDVSQEQQRAAIERIFFHDINNMLGTLVGASELLMDSEPSNLSKMIHRASLRLSEEIAIQRTLMQQDESPKYHVKKRKLTPEAIITELKTFFYNHPAAYKKEIEFSENYPHMSFNSDFSLLSRILCNMIINALEANEENGIVKVWISNENNRLLFNVWNAQEIPYDITKRIFQRNFSTKALSGRGLGTFSMKLLGEKILGGKVNFTTSKESGTTFCLSLPL